MVLIISSIIISILVIEIVEAKKELKLQKALLEECDKVIIDLTTNN